MEKKIGKKKKKKNSMTEWINRIKVWTVIIFNKMSTFVMKYEMWFHNENNHFELYTQDINFFSHVFVFLFYSYVNNSIDEIWIKYKLQ